MATALKVTPATITPKSAQGDFPAWDSMGHVQLMVALEDAFGIALEVEDFMNLTSVQAILDHLKTQGIE
jgi:acyl carrier protein